MEDGGDRSQPNEGVREVMSGGKSTITVPLELQKATQQKVTSNIKLNPKT